MVGSDEAKRQNTKKNEKEPMRAAVIVKSLLTSEEVTRREGWYLIHHV